MKKTVAGILACILPAIVVSYGLGDYFGWWDQVSGRSIAGRGAARLASGKGYPDMYIYQEELEFPPLKRIIDQHSVNPQLIARRAASQEPTLITCTPIRRDKTTLPKGWPDFFFVPSSSPVLYVYGDSRASTFNSNQVIWVGTLADLPRWIDASRNSERFWVSTIILGIMGILVAILQFERRGTPQQRPERDS